MATVINSFAISGVDGYGVEVEVDLIYGQPSISIVGLGDMAIKESRERLQAAMVKAGFEFPKVKVVINLAPSDMKKRGTHYDLAMAIGLLEQSEQLLPLANLKKMGFIGELSLNAYLRPCAGVLPMAIRAQQMGLETLIVPEDNVQEASLVKGITVYGFQKLQDVVDFLRGDSVLPTPAPTETPDFLELPVDFKEVQGQDTLIEYLVLAAAGGHNMLMIGPPGCGKSMIAKRIPTILPSMTEEESLEVTKIYSVAGMLKNRGDLIRTRPFRDPHHNASTNALIGGGNFASPGEISLAHHGVLFLDEIAEFQKKTLDALRQPIEDRSVTITRVKSTNTYPCNFMLIAAMNPCPCGYYGQSKCRCSDYEVFKYQQTISGPILDRMDVQKYVQPVNIFSLTSGYQGRSSQELRERVELARSIQKRRYADVKGVTCNAQMTSALMDEYCQLDEGGMRLLQKAYEKFQYNARSFYKFKKLARTYADLDGSEIIRLKDVAAALSARDLDKDQKGMVVL